MNFKNGSIKRNRIEKRPDAARNWVTSVITAKSNSPSKLRLKSKAAFGC